MDTNGLDWFALLLAIVGAVTWGIIGVTGLMGETVNVVSLLLEPVFRPEAADIVEYLIYILVGVAGIYLLYTAYKMGRASRRSTRERRRRDATRAETTDYADTDESPNTDS